MNKELLDKYCRNSCSEEELEIVLKWFERSAGTPEGKTYLFKIWEELQDKEESPDTDFDLLLDRIHHQINLNRTNELMNESDFNLIKFKRKRYYITLLTKAAAILMLPALGLGLYMAFKYQSVRNTRALFTMSYNEVFSSVDAITKVSLPDGSNIWLNHNSSLRYPSVFGDNSRNVELKGEGYFEVAHNERKPFIVTAGTIQIEAVGTTFNVMAYPEEDRVETSLIDGRVELHRTGSNGKIIHMLEMKPNDLAVFQKANNEITNIKIDDDRYFSWKNGKLVFNGTPMDEVARKLGRWFNVDIQINDPKLLKLTYTATFVQESLPQVLELISLMSPVSYSISERELISPGTFAKRKINLYYKRK
jgi:transmembrane sensor